MKNTLVIVTDLGGFKAYRLENHTPKPTRRLLPVEEFKNADAHEKIVEKVTDQSGRFPRSTGSWGATGVMSDGERHNLELESRRRMVRQLAQRLNTLAKPKEIESCFLAASREINRQLLDELAPEVRAKIEKIVPADLTKLERTEILRHF